MKKAIQLVIGLVLLNGGFAWASEATEGLTGERKPSTRASAFCEAGPIQRKDVLESQDVRKERESKSAAAE